MTSTPDEQKLRDEVIYLNSQLAVAHTQLNNANSALAIANHALPSHALLLLTDSALPLGSFAFSSGLESYLAHHAPSHKNLSTTLPNFLSMSLHSLASTTLPYLIAVYKSPHHLQELDSELDACTLCPVAKRASIAQGRALLTLWDRALRSSCESSSPASQALADFSLAIKKPAPPSLSSDMEQDEDALNFPQAHFGLIYATVCAAMGVTLHEAAYTYLFNHAKAVVSAGVRASLTGPYAAQSLLGSVWLRHVIGEVMGREWERPVEDAGQSVVMLDIWIGRHELLYSRIFNS